MTNSIVYSEFNPVKFSNDEDIPFHTNKIKNRVFDSINYKVIKGAINFLKYLLFNGFCLHQQMSEKIS